MYKLKNERADIKRPNEMSVVCRRVIALIKIAANNRGHHCPSSGVLNISYVLLTRLNIRTVLYKHLLDCTEFKINTFFFFKLSLA